MILHASVTADDPRYTAETIALLIDGETFPIGPGVGTWMAMPKAGDQLIEVLKRGSEFHRVPQQHVETRIGSSIMHSGFHLLIETALSEEEVLRLAEERGALAHRSTHGFFDVIEFWIDDCLLLEIATPELAASYRRIVGIDNARAYMKLRQANGVQP